MKVWLWMLVYRVRLRYRRWLVRRRLKREIERTWNERLWW